MKYMLLMYASEAEAPNFTPEELQAIGKEWQTLLIAAKAAGVLLANNGLAPITTATTVRIREGKALTVDGPFAETHEQLGGFLMLNCQDLDEAIQWAKKVPHARYGSVEIRPLWDQV
ncbi:MAG: YciI family protein [Ardenticatenaceae bacterium]|nr:YciI family protein [Anaerolineales bacterium]MCB8938664.1 YciI family protein [Ardenticatenaceae bacterium]MCB8973900.1 YciI family protein [Ardenticatenaceae bacterium]